MTPSRAISSRIASGTTSRTRIVRAPTAIPASAQLVPPTWKRGMATRLTVSRVKPKAAAAAALWAARLRWVSIAPLGKPVVPEV